MTGFLPFGMRGAVVDSRLRGNDGLGEIGALRGRQVFQFYCIDGETGSPFVVSLSNHGRAALRQAQGERENKPSIQSS